MDSSLFLVSGICQKAKSLAFNEGFDVKGIKFYPVKVKYLFEFYMVVSVLMVRQDRTKDRTLMKLPYLWFLLYAWDKADQYQRFDFSFYMTSLLALIELTTGESDIDINYQYNQNGKLIKCDLIIKGIEFNYKEFEQIREVILEQAGMDWNMDFVNEDAEKAVQEGIDFENKQSGFIAPSLEDLLDLTSMYLHMGVDEICEKFTIRKFNNLVKRMAIFEEYKLLRGAELSGMVALKKPVPYWVAGLEKADIFKNENKNYRSSNLMKI